MKSIAIAVLGLTILASATLIQAQFIKGPLTPLATTMTIEKPSTDTNMRNRNFIYVGVKDKSYRFILRDAYVNDPTGKFMWQDIWRSVEQFRPNFLAQGVDSDVFEKLKPGEVVTINGIYIITTRTFEVSNVTPGAGSFAPKTKY